MNHELLKKHIQSRLNETVSEFQERGDIVSSFLNPIIAYVDAEDMDKRLYGIPLAGNGT